MTKRAMAPATHHVEIGRGASHSRRSRPPIGSLCPGPQPSCSQFFLVFTSPTCFAASHPTSNHDNRTANLDHQPPKYVRLFPLYIPPRSSTVLTNRSRWVSSFLSLRFATCHDRFRTRRCLDDAERRTTRLDPIELFSPTCALKAWRLGAMIRNSMPDRRRRGKLSGLGSDEICATAFDEIFETRRHKPNALAQPNATTSRNILQPDTHVLEASAATWHELADNREP